MNKKTLFLLSIFLLGVLACRLTSNPIIPTQKAEPTLAAKETAALPTLTTLPASTAVPSTSKPIAGETPPAGSLPDYSSSVFLDDRSTAGALVLSYANAISRHEFLRAYYYWINPLEYLGTLDNFSTIFMNISSVQVVFGSITSDGAAGSLYYTVPAVLKYLHPDSTSERYAACFLVRLPQPGNYGAPPITPMNFERGVTELLTSSTSDDGALSSACSAPDYANGGLPGSPVIFESISDLSLSNYIDNRSGAVEVVSSLINAINRKEYVRVYSYWENPAVTPGDYNSYTSGFSDTQSISATFGTVISDAGAGQWYYLVPVAEVVQTTSATTKTYVGCYTLHISNPGIQGAPPFRPLAITNGKFSLVANDADISSLLQTACN
jgi:hypothetical protein